MKTHQLPLAELEGIVHRCEAKLQAGTSSHADVVRLIEAEREILRREQQRSNASIRTTRTSRTGRSTGGGGPLRF